MSEADDRYPTETLHEDYDDGTMPDNVDTLAAAVVGRRIISVEKDAKVKARYPSTYRPYETATVITLDDGRRVALRDTDDCCAYTELEAFLLHPERVDHIITGVGTTDGFTRWHIYADMDDTHTLNEHGTTDCPIERVRAYADPEDGVGLVCSACGAIVDPAEVSP